MYIVIMHSIHVKFFSRGSFIISAHTSFFNTFCLYILPLLILYLYVPLSATFATLFTFYCLLLIEHCFQNMFMILFLKFIIYFYATKKLLENIYFLYESLLTADFRRIPWIRLIYEQQFIFVGNGLLLPNYLSWY